MAVALAALLALPIAEAIVRTVFDRGIPGSGPFVQHLTLWVLFLGAAVAAREGKLLAMASGQFLRGGAKQAAGVFAAAVAAAASVLLAVASWQMMEIDREVGTELAVGVPVWLAQAVMPLAFAVIALRLVWRAAEGWRARGVAALGLLAGGLLSLHPEWLDGRPGWIGLTILIAAALAGGPIFAVLGGAAVYLFMIDAVPMAAVPAETYRLSVSQTLPAIPLFTLTGFLLAQGKSSERLLRVFRGFFGWLPGGTAVVATVLCAFFTIFTGGSGVTILALGALLFSALETDGYSERFSLGLLTASGSLGLLFAPALPLILYGIVARVPIRDLFIGGLLPGVLLVVLMAGWGMRQGLRGGVERRPFVWREARVAAWEAKWELMLPVAALVVIFGGFATLVEAAAFIAAFAVVIVTLLHRELGWRRLAATFAECTVLLGGVLIILAVAMGLTGYLVDAMVPARILEWAEQHIESPLVFLLALNVFLLLVGCLMDIFSAIVVVVPLIVPLGLAFGIDPIHLGIIFVANLELGYLTPPVGLNL
ncbi:MAG: TRAP transporter large permease subunit, partial [Acidobacteria bacterium]|nr:TRAP transporter large permease subunit [Acidobacteriota bacterium]